MITYKIVDKTFLPLYDTISMNVPVSSYLEIIKIDNGLGGFKFNEVPVSPYIKVMGTHANASKYEEQFDLSNWGFIMAFDDDKPIGGAMIASKTDGVNMLANRDDLAVLWDLRVEDDYKHQGIGQNLFNLAVKWSQERNLIQMKIECQNNNIPAIKFYHKQGAILSAIDEYAYYNEPDFKHEIELIWYLDL